MDDPSILVLGAGELGLSVLRGLGRHPNRRPDSTLSVLLRPSTIRSDDPAKRRDLDELRSFGVDLVPGDLASPSADLAAIFGGYHTVVGCTGYVGGRGTQIKIARAALEAGVRRYVPWQFGADYDVIGRGSAQDLFDEQLDVRDLLRSQAGTNWIIISTGMFTSFLFDLSFGVVDLAENTVNALGSWDTAVTVTTPGDIGTLTAEILLADPEIADQVVYTAGDTITYARLADLVESASGRPVRRIESSLPRLRDELAQDPGNAVKKYRVVFAEGRGVAWDVEKSFNARREIRVADVEDWLRANRGRVQGNS